jgi:hypothetical protein
VAVLCCLATTHAFAQGSSSSLLFRPGFLAEDFISAPRGTLAATGFNLRVEARLTTARSWLAPLVGVHVAPYGTVAGPRKGTNAPTLFVGNAFPVLTASRTGGWLEFEVPLLLAYSYGGGGPHNAEPYGRDLVLEGSVSVLVGQRLLSQMSRGLSRWRVYVLLDQNLTPNPDPSTGRTDRFNPVAMYGLTVPLGGRSDQR